MQPTYLLCISNAGYPASLEVRKLYEQLADADAETEGFVRVVDESGEDYLFPAKMFMRVELPAAVAEALAAAGR